MTRTILPLLLCGALLLTGCGSAGPGGGDDSDRSIAETEPSQTEIPTDENEPPPETDDAQAPAERPDDRPRNRAVERIAGFESLPDDRLMAVKNYHDAMGWAEANEIANLDRSAVEPGGYFLIVPQYAGSSVTVEPMSFWDGMFVPGEPVYRLDACPDDYALIVNSLMPEGGPTKQVTVSYDGESSTYRFDYDGRGDRVYPYLADGYFLIEASPDGGLTPVFSTEKQDAAGVFAADVDYGHAGFGYYVRFTGRLPADWREEGYDHNTLSHIWRVDGVQIRIWGFLDTPDNHLTVTHFVGIMDDPTELTSTGRQIVHRAFGRDGPAYAFELEDGLCVMVEFCIENGADPGLLARTADRAVCDLRDSIAVELTEAEFRSPPK